MRNFVGDLALVCATATFMTHAMGQGSESFVECDAAKQQEKLAAEVKLDKNISEASERLDRFLQMQDKLLDESRRAGQEYSKLLVSPTARIIAGSGGDEGLARYMPELAQARQAQKSAESLLSSVQTSIQATTVAMSMYLKFKTDLASICVPTTSTKKQ